MRQLIAASLALAVAAPLAAQTKVTPDIGDPVSLRRTAMQQTGAAIGTLARMAKQEAPFDAALAGMAIRTMMGAASGYGLLFPEGSGGEGSRAAPAIWTDPAGFQAAWAKHLADLDGVLAAPPTDLASLGPVMGTIGANCQACHEKFQLPRN